MCKNTRCASYLKLRFWVTQSVTHGSIQDATVDFDELAVGEVRSVAFVIFLFATGSKEQGCAVI
jgi:hypothetical protein